MGVKVYNRFNKRKTSGFNMKRWFSLYFENCLKIYGFGVTIEFIFCKGFSKFIF